MYKAGEKREGRPAAIRPGEQISEFFPPEVSGKDTSVVSVQEMVYQFGISLKHIKQEVYTYKNVLSPTINKAIEDLVKDMTVFDPNAPRQIEKRISLEEARVRLDSIIEEIKKFSSVHPA